MKKLIAIAAALLSLSSFAGNLDKTEIVWITGAESGQAAYAEAMEMVEAVKADTFGRASFSFLKECNPTLENLRNNFDYKRKAYTSTSRVKLDHVSGLYGTTVVVLCKK
jgi:hypothetical protein